MSVCNKKWKSAHGRIGWCLGYLHAEASLDRNMLWSWILLKKTSGVWKNVEFCIQWLTARMLRYLSMCWTSCLSYSHMAW